MIPARRWQGAAIAAVLIASAMVGHGVYFRSVNPWQRLLRDMGMKPAAAFLGRLGAKNKAGLLGPAVKPEFRMDESSEQAGLVFIHEALKVHPSLAHIQALLGYAGAHVVVVDYDRDGWMDVILAGSAQGSRTAVFRNRGNGTFEDAAARAGLSDLTREHGVTRLLAFEADGDGRPDLLVATYWRARLFLNKRGGFKEVAGVPFPPGPAYATTALDVDGDGRLDLAIGYEAGHPEDLLAPKRFDFMKYSPALAYRDPGPVRLYKNLGGGKFIPFPGQPELPHSGPIIQAFAVRDFLGNGRSGLYMACDFGPDQMFLNRDGKKLEDISPRVRRHTGLSGMNAEIADLDGDGRPVIFVSHHSQPGGGNAKNVMWKLPEEESSLIEHEHILEEEAVERGVDKCGLAWGGRFMDLDADGKLDLVVVNGGVTGKERRGYFLRLGTIRQAALEVQADARNWPKMGESSLDGHQQDCAFLNTDRGFVDVGASLRFDEERLDGRGVADIDAANDGGLGVLVANRAAPLRYWRVEPKARRRWIGFILKGPPANPDAWGAKIRLRLDDGRSMSEEVQPANGYASQKDPRPRFSLGPRAKIVSAEIRWPGGDVTAAGALPIDRYHRFAAPASAPAAL